MPATTAPVPIRTGLNRRAHSRARHHAGFWVIAFAFFVAMAFSAAPAPLYPLYQARDGFSTFTITIIFAAYAVGVVISLILAGHVSDWVGRKNILVPALALELVAAILFLAVPELWVILLARVLSGLGIGMLTATATAHLHDLHVKHRPDVSKRRFEVVSTAANIGGIGSGPLIAGVLAQHVGEPLRTPYVVFAVLLIVSIIGVVLTPETVEARTVKPRYRPQRVSAQHGDRVRFIAALGSGFVAFALLGIFTSVAPGFIAGSLQQTSPAIAGSVVFAVFGAATVAQTATTRMGLQSRQVSGLAALAVGLVLLVVGMAVGSLPMFLTGGILAGAGAGLLFTAAVGTVSAGAAPERRGEALAGLFLASYVGLSVPAVGIGVATLSVTPVVAMGGLAVILLLVIVGLGVLAFRRRA